MEIRVQGLVYLLSLALRVLTLVEWVVRERLRQEQAQLQGIYAGQPGRKTDRPSAELLLGALQAISISVVEVDGRVHALLTPLTEVQQRLLELWDLPADLYDRRLLVAPPHRPGDGPGVVETTTRASFTDWKLAVTSCAMIAGMVPMAVGWSEGGEQTAPLGRAVIGGLAAATVATLIVLPTVFALVQGKASHESASLDPDDPTSPHYHEEEEESREPARPSADGEPRVSQPQGPDRGLDTSAASGHDLKH